MAKIVKFFSERISDRINEENLAGLDCFGITYDWSDSTITFYAEVNEYKKIVRVGSELFYIDGDGLAVIHYGLPGTNGARGIITELFEPLEWKLFDEGEENE